jgi:hypothetical protein
MDKTFDEQSVKPNSEIIAEYRLPWIFFISINILH